MSVRRAMSAVALILLATPSLAARGAQASSTEVVTELRIHGNYSIPDVDIMRLAGVVPGDRLESGALDAIETRLRASNRFEDVEVRKRYTSLSRSDQVALILVVRERPAPATGSRGGPSALRRVSPDSLHADAQLCRGPRVDLRRSL